MYGDFNHVSLVSYLCSYFPDNPTRRHVMPAFPNIPFASSPSLLAAFLLKQ